MENDCLLSGKHKSIDFTKNIHFEICKRLLYLVEFLPLYWGGYGGLIITHRLKNDDSGVWGSSSIFSPLIYFSLTEKKNTKAHMKRKKRIVEEKKSLRAN